MALSAQVEVRGAELLLWVIALDPDRGRVQWYNPEASGTGLSLMTPTSPGQGSLPGVGRAATQKGWGLSPSQAWLPVLPLPPTNPRTLGKPQMPLSAKLTEVMVVQP